MNYRKATDPYAEAVLAKLSIPYTIQDVPMSSIAINESANPARLGAAVDREHVTDLATAIQNGDALPMPVLNKAGRKYGILAGHHRIPAAKACGVKSVPAYIVEGSDDFISNVLPGALNAAVRQQSRDERTRLAADAITKYGLTAARAAEVYGLQVQAIYDDIRIGQCRQELAEAGIDSLKIPKTAIKWLLPIKNENVMVAAAAIVANAKLGVEETKAMSMDIRRERTEAQQMAVVANREKLFGVNGDTTRRRLRFTPAHRFKIVVGQLEGVLANARTLQQFGITEKNEREAVAEKAVRAGKKLLQVCKRS